MKYKHLGISDIKVSAVGLGTMGYGGRYEREEQSANSSINLIKTAVDLGVNFFDTAEVYGEGYGEEILGKAVSEIRDDVVIATKFAPANSGYKDVLRAAERSLKRLSTDFIDLYQMHWPAPQVPIEETFGALVSLVEQGKIRAIGLSNVTVTYTRNILRFLPQGFPLVSMQQDFSLLERFVEPRILPFCEDNALSLIAYSPLGQGRLAVRDGRTEILRNVAERYGMTLSQVALQWVVRKEETVAIPMTSRETNLRSNATALDRLVDDADMDAITHAFAPDIRPIPVDAIKVMESHTGKVYSSLEQARTNTLGMSPSPQQLAEEMRDGEMLKPVKVRPKSGTADRFELYEGQLRYWAWVIAHDGEEPITALVEHGTKP